MGPNNDVMDQEKEAITMYIYMPNSMAYGTRRFNATFTRALQ